MRTYRSELISGRWFGRELSIFELHYIPEWHSECNTILIFKKSQVRQEKSEFQNFASKLPNWQPARDQLLHETIIVGRGNCCVTRPGIRPPWLSEEICTVRFMVFLQFLAYYLILLDLQLIDFPRACTISRETPSRFPRLLLPGKLLPDFHPGNSFPISTQALLPTIRLLLPAKQKRSMTRHAFMQLLRFQTGVSQQGPSAPLGGHGAVFLGTRADAFTK